MDVILTIQNPDATSADGIDVIELPLCTVPTVAAVASTTSGALPDAIAEAAAQAAVLGGQIIRVVARGDDDDHEYPVVGVKEFAECRGIERHYASQVSRSVGFPREAAVLGAGPVWELADVARWIRDADNGTHRSRRRRRTT